MRRRMMLGEVVSEVAAAFAPMDDVLVIRIGIRAVNVGEKRSLATGLVFVRVQLRGLVVRVTGQSASVSGLPSAKLSVSVNS